MQELFYQLGIDWRLLLSQAVNFLLLLIVLRIFAYGPIMEMLKNRRAKIEEGLIKAAEAGNRLNQMNQMVREKMKETEHRAMAVMLQTEEKAKHLEARLMEDAKKKQEGVLKETESLVASKAEEAKAKIEREAAELVKKAVVKMVEMKPEEIDYRLVEKAIAELKRT